MILPILPFVVLSSSPLKFELEVTSLESNRAKAEVHVKNMSRSTLVLVKPIFDGNPSASCVIEVLRSGTSLFCYGESSTPYVQVMDGNRVTADRFIKLLPGERATLAFQYFDGYFETKRPGYAEKSDLVASNRRQFEAGKYEVKASYTFSRSNTIDLFSGEPKKLEFGPGAKSLWNMAWNGTANLKGEFVVR